VEKVGCGSGWSWKKGPPHTVRSGLGKLAEVSADDPLLFGEFKVHDDCLLSVSLSERYL